MKSGAGIATGCIVLLEAPVRDEKSEKRDFPVQARKKEWICIRSEWDWMAVKPERLHLDETGTTIESNGGLVLMAKESGWRV